jgi:hypothetical protein
VLRMVTGTVTGLPAFKVTALLFGTPLDVTLTVLSWTDPLKGAEIRVPSIAGAKSRASVQRPAAGALE